MDGGGENVEMERNVAARGDDLLSLFFRHRFKKKQQSCSSSASLPVLDIHKSFHRFAF